MRKRPYFVVMDNRSKTLGKGKVPMADYVLFRESGKKSEFGGR